MSFRRDALLEIGMFDPRISFAGEDEDICRRLRERFGPRAFPLHPSPVTLCSMGSFRRHPAPELPIWPGKRGYLKNEDQGPTIFPMPVIFAALLLFGARRRWPRVVASVLPFVMFSHWPAEALRRRRAELLAFPIVQLLEEAAHDLGFVKSWLQLRREYARPQAEEARS